VRQLTDYALGIRCPGAPPMPGGIKAIELQLGGCVDDDPIARAVDTLACSGLTGADFRSRVVFLANDDAGGETETLLLYAALCGLAGRRVDAYAAGVVLEFSRPDRQGGDVVDAGRPPAYLEWAQAGGPVAEGMPTVALKQIGPAEVTVIRNAARLRFVPPPSAKAALDAFITMAGIRRRKRERFPYLSTGYEPVPVGKDDPRQGIDLEGVRLAAEQLRKQLRRSAATEATIVPPTAVSPRLVRIAEANTVDIRSVLRRLGSTADESGRWFCPRSGRQGLGHPGPTVRVSGDNRAQCNRCDQENLTPVRLVVETLDLAPDEAVSFVTEDGGAVEVGATVTAHVTGVESAGYACTVMDAGRSREALLFPADPGDLPDHVVPIQWSPGDTVTALVTGVLSAPDGRLALSVTVPGLIDRILAVFVQELCSGNVIITAVARVVGARTKIVVAATRKNIDARGAFVGPVGNRVLAAKGLLNRSYGRERLEIIEYADDRRAYLLNAMNPTIASDALIRDGHAVVAVDEHLQDGGVGEGGLNAQLAGRLTGLYVRVVPIGTDLPAALTRLISERAAEQG
jgi:transcription antitermination factor NusA-like protein